MKNALASARHLDAHALPASAFAVLLLGMASNHTHVGLVTHTLYVLTVITFCVQAVLAFKRA